MKQTDTRNRKDGGWFWINNAITREYGAILDIYARFIYTVLAQHANNSSNSCRVFLQTLADESTCGLTKVKKCIKQLEEAGLIRIESGKGRNRANTFYLLKVGRVATLDRSHGDLFTTEKGRVATDVFKTKAETEVNKTKAEEVPAEPPSGPTTAPPPVGGPNTPPDPPEPHLRQPSANGEVPKKPPQRAEDDRQRIVDEIHVQYQAHNPGIQVPWTPLAFLRLKREVERVKGWTIDQWVECVRNRFESDGIISGELPESFIPYLSRYISGPIDRYRNVKGGTNVSVNARTARNRAAVEEVLRDIDREFGESA